MNIENKINVLQTLRHELERQSQQDSELIQKAFASNPWFHPIFSQYAITSICFDLLWEESLKNYAHKFFGEVYKSRKRIALVPAGNIPLAGFRDLLDLYLSDHTILFKASSKDSVLMEWVYTFLSKNDPSFSSRVEWSERIRNADSIIASGSNNTYRYLEYYFRDKPFIIRKNRVSLAILTGQETEEDLTAFADDVFLYFGLGCRNVSHIYVPNAYSFDHLMNAFEKYKWFFSESKFMNNYDYNRTLLLLNNTPHLSSDWFMLVENPNWISPLAELHFTRYENMEEVKQSLQNREEEYQCIVSSSKWEAITTIEPGKAQRPSLFDFADGINIPQFLGRLANE